MSHYLTTRWNVRGFGGLYRDPDWLAERQWLFESFCLPSVRRQIARDFCWLILVDVETPPEARAWLAGCDQRIQLVPVGADPRERALAIRAVIRSGSIGWLQVIHGRNLANTPQARRSPRAPERSCSSPSGCAHRTSHDRTGSRETPLRAANAI